MIMEMTVFILYGLEVQVESPVESPAAAATIQYQYKAFSWNDVYLLVPALSYSEVKLSRVQ